MKTVVVLAIVFGVMAAIMDAARDYGPGLVR